jgi:acyl-CoA synthetase (AMP-forming)/AMP-acid ligase II
MTDNFFPTTLPEALQQNINGSKSITYIAGQTEQHSVTYQQLHTQALRLLYQFQQAGMRQGNELIILTEDNEKFIQAFWAAMIGGIIPVPLTAAGNNTALQKVISVLQKLEEPWLWTSESLFPRLQDYAQENNLNHLIPELENNVLFTDQVVTNENEGAPGIVNPEDTAFIQFSSGSTGSPKGVILSHQNLLSNIRSIIAGAELTGADSTLSWMPLTHDMGIIGFHMVPLVLNVDAYIIPSDKFVRRPSLWLDKISETAATATSSPNFGYQHLLKHFDPEKHGHLDLSSIRLIFNGAEPISAALCRRFNETLKPFGLSENALFPVYGLAEASLAATFPRPSETISSIYVKRGSLQIGAKVQISPKATADSKEMVRLGQPLPGTEIRIQDSGGQIKQENQLGHVFIRGPNVTAGYYHDDAITAESITEEHWLNTGDLGFINEGQLVISGRHKELLIVNGQNFHPHDLEQLCEMLADVGPGKAVACAVSSDSGEQLVIFIAYRGELEQFVPIAANVRKTISLNAGIDTANIIPVASFPKTTSGKIQRFMLAEQYADGQYQEIIEQLEKSAHPIEPDNNQASSIEVELLEICNTFITDKTVGVNDDLFEIGTSSLELAQIHEKIDSLFPEQVELTDLFELPTIAELADFLEQKKAK